MAHSDADLWGLRFWQAYRGLSTSNWYLGHALIEILTVFNAAKLLCRLLIMMRFLLLLLGRSILRPTQELQARA